MENKTETNFLAETIKTIQQLVSDLLQPKPVTVSEPLTQLGKPQTQEEKYPLDRKGSTPLSTYENTPFHVVVQEEASPSSTHNLLIDEKTFNRLFPNAVKGVYQLIDKHILLTGCTTKDQQAIFLAQCAVESQNFTKFEESLYYSVDGLLRVFPKRMSVANANLYGRIPKVRPANQRMIANIVYGSRGGNRGTNTDDGYNYRGRGMIQLTFLDNYKLFNSWLNRPHLNVVDNPDLISQSLELSVLTAVWFWQYRQLAKYKTVKEVTYLVNGGYHGLQERIDTTNKLA